MAKSKDEIGVAASSVQSHFEFELDEATRKEIIQCIEKTGKISLQLQSAGISKLPGRGALNDVEGKLID